jgi:hypothetical protein
MHLLSHGMYPSRVSLRHLSQNKCVTSRNQVYTCLLQVVYMSVELALLYAYLCNYGIVKIHGHRFAVFPTYFEKALG